MHREGMRGSLPEGTRTILFDLEGTLVDFQWDLAGAVRDVLSMLQASGISPDKVRSRSYSTLMPEAMQLARLFRLSAESVRQSIGEIYEKYDEDASSRWRLRSGAKEFITRSRKMGIKTGLVSNVGRKTLSRSLMKIGLDGLFDIALCRDDVQWPKPHPEGINLAIKALHSQKSQTLFIGDSLDDINASRNAGIRIIVIEDGESRTEDIRAASPDGIIQTYSELLIVK